MEVILLENIETLGTRGQVCKVADGYGRNYLLPKKLAVAATPQNRKWVGQQRVRFLKLEAKEKAESEDLAQLMQGIELVMTRRSGEKGQLFGSVTSMDIEEALAAQGFKINRRKIQLGSPLKVLGEFDVPVKLHKEVTVTLKVKVEAEAESEPAVPELEKAPAEAAQEAAPASEAGPATPEEAEPAAAETEQVPPKE